MTIQVGFDASPIRRSRTGIGNYCYYLLAELLRRSEGCRFKAFSSGVENASLEGVGEVGMHRHLFVPTRALYLSWELFGAPKVDTLLGGADVFHATNYYLPPTRLARRVVTIHDLTFLRAPELCSPKIVKLFARNVGRFCREADAVIADSEWTKGDIIKYLEVDGSKITVAHLAVGEHIARRPPDEAAHLVRARYGIEGPFLLSVGTIEPRKNIVGLLRAFALLAERLPHRLVLIGSLGWNAQEVLRTIDDLALGTRVERPGYVPDEDLASFYSAADAFVIPSHYEGFGLPLLEAMTCGCPAVAAGNSSLPEVGGDGPVYVDSRDEEGLAAAMESLVTDEELRAGVVARGLAQSAKFSWRKCADITVGIYKKLAA